LTFESGNGSLEIELKDVLLARTVQGLITLSGMGPRQKEPDKGTIIILEAVA
jgi:hypothetical protein